MGLDLFVYVVCCNRPASAKLQVDDEGFSAPTDVKLVLVLQRKLNKAKSRLEEAHGEIYRLRHVKDSDSMVDSESASAESSPYRSSASVNTPRPPPFTVAFDETDVGRLEVRFFTCARQDLDTSLNSIGSEFDNNLTGSEMSDDDLDLDDNMDVRFHPHATSVLRLCYI